MPPCSRSASEPPTKKAETFASGCGCLILTVFGLYITGIGGCVLNVLFGSPPPLPSLERTISGNAWIGCVHREDFDRLASYVAQGDQKVFGQFLRERLSTGACIQFKRGETVYIMDAAVFSGAVQVRRKGETQEYWTPFEAVKE